MIIDAFKGRVRATPDRVGVTFVNVRALLGDDWPLRVPDAPALLRAYLDYFVRSGFVDAPVGDDRGAPQLTGV